MRGVSGGRADSKFTNKSTKRSKRAKTTINVLSSDEEVQGKSLVSVVSFSREQMSAPDARRIAFSVNAHRNMEAPPSKWTTLSERGDVIDIGLRSAGTGGLSLRTSVIYPLQVVCTPKHGHH